MKKWIFITLISLIYLPVHAGIKECNNFYQKLHDQDRLSFLIVYGYKDSRPDRFVGDKYEKLYLAEKLTAKCTITETILCEFNRDPDNADRFEKNIELVGKKNIAVSIDLMNSSVTEDDKMNRRSKYQGWKSKYTENVFSAGFKNYDVIFYNGHSRVSGGPDFSPPKILQSGKVKYFHYMSNKPGIEMIKKNLTTESKTKVLGFFSCASSKYFKKDILSLNPELAYISSPNLLYYTDANTNLLAATRSLIEGDCFKKINEKLRAGKVRVGSVLEYKGKSKFLKQSD